MKLEHSKGWWMKRIDEEPDGPIGAGVPDQVPERSAGASSQCPHSDIHYHLNNAHFGNTNLHYLEITAKCKICDADMVWQGVPLGVSPKHPTVSVDGKELCLPFLGDGEELVGKPIGFSVNLQG